MKQVYLFFVCCLFLATANAQFVFIPDQNFKNILLYSNCIDSNGDGTYNTDVDVNNNGFIEVWEAQNITKLIINSSGETEEEIETLSITDLTGLQAFTNLQQLRIYNQPNLSTVVLNDFDLDVLVLSNVGVENLDISSISSLEVFSIHQTNLVNLDFSSLNILDQMLVYENPLLETLVLGEYDGITFLCSSNPMLYALEMESLGYYDYAGEGLFIDSIYINNNESLSYLNFKNGANDQGWYFPAAAEAEGRDSPARFFVMENLPNLQTVCVDEINTWFTEAFTLEVGHPVNFTEYCSFAPGGISYVVNGSVKVDYNEDGCDETDMAFNNFPLNVSNGSEELLFEYYANSNSGEYSIPLPEGSYVITPQLENEAYFSVEPESLVVDFIQNPTDVIQDFCITPNGDFNDLEVSIIPLNQARPGFEADYKVICKNKGTTTLSGDVTLSFDDNVMSVVETTPVSSNENEGELLWDFMDLAPFQTEQFYITMLLNTPTDTNFPLLGGEVLEFTAALEFEGTDETPEDNTASLFQTVVNSFDPNDKTCLEGASITESQVGDYVTYVVRFENTGTASAINVVVKDYIDIDKYDVSSLMPLDASHEFYTRITEGNKVEFIFEDINLPFEDAANDGFVAFKLKTLSTLQPGDEFSNEAEIYFDYNAAIHTNNATTVVEDALSIEEISKEGIVSVYPNPVSNVLNFRTSESLLSIAIYDLQGRLVKQQDITQGVENFKCDVSSLSKGMYTVQAKTAKGEQFFKVIKD